MTERVFDVLDRDGRGRIGVEQIVDGLRLLQLPATHNQVGVVVMSSGVWSDDSNSFLSVIRSQIMCT
jgi:hypothetical protein